MQLSEAMKVALNHRQTPMTASQIAYFLSANKTVVSDQLDELIYRVEEEALYSPSHFALAGELIQLSPWNEREREIIQQAFNTISTASSICRNLTSSSSCCHNLVMTLLLYKRLSDIKRSQQHSAPIVPSQLKFNHILLTTPLVDLPARLHDVLEYIEYTDGRIGDTFLFSRKELSQLCSVVEMDMLYKIMCELSSLHLDEDRFPTPLFQAVFSRLFSINIRRTSRALS